MPARMKAGAYYRDNSSGAEHRASYDAPVNVEVISGGESLAYGATIQARRVSDGRLICFAARDLAPAVSVPESSPAREAAPGAAFAIEAHIHTKKGFPMWICVTPERVDRAAFDAFRDRAQSVGGWYSRPWGRTPGGFAFKVESDARDFAGIGAGIDAAAPVTAPNAAPIAAPAAKLGASLAERLRGIAEGLETPIAAAFRDRLANTPRRQKQAAEARSAGYDLQRAQKAALALAAAHDAGAVPALLASVKTKAQLIDLASERRIHDGGYYDAGRGTGKPRSDTPAAAALWALLDGGGVDPAAVAAEALRQKIAGLQFANIPGYFPTPAAVVARMIDAADIAPGHLVLEPSAGSGAILDAIHDACPGAVLECYEKSFTLFEILQAKGYTIAGRDFVDGAGTAGHYDRILMNPPFEGGQDAAHIRLAFDLLKEGGRLVAIMSPGPFFRSDSKSQAFRDWFDAMGGDRETLPAGSFKESGTGVETLMIELRK
jgi:hypothetical protein